MIAVDLEIKAKKKKRKASNFKKSVESGCLLSWAEK